MVFSPPPSFLRLSKSTPKPRPRFRLGVDLLGSPDYPFTRRRWPLGRAFYSRSHAPAWERTQGRSRVLAGQVAIPYRFNGAASRHGHIPPSTDNRSLITVFCSRSHAPAWEWTPGRSRVLAGQMATPYRYNGVASRHGHIPPPTDNRSLITVFPFPLSSKRNRCDAATLLHDTLSLRHFHCNCHTFGRLILHATNTTIIYLISVIYANRAVAVPLRPGLTRKLRIKLKSNYINLLNDEIS